MRYACLIITYTSAVQTRRIIDKLNNGDFDFYIHLDKKVNINTHRSLFNIPGVYFIKNRIKVNWAGFTIVQASFNGIKEIVASGREYAFINLMSGQDYPVKSADYISEFLSRNIGKQLINARNFDEWTEANSRINRFHLTDVIFKGKYVLEKMLNNVYRHRKAPKWLKFYGSNSTFWTLSPDCANYVVNVVESNIGLYYFYKYTWGSDEFVFQTMIMNSHFMNQVADNNYRYTDWSGGGAHPKTLLTEDFHKIMESDAIFGRKFSIKTDSLVMDMIDEANVNYEAWHTS